MLNSSPEFTDDHQLVMVANETSRRTMILVPKLNVKEHLLDAWLPRSGMHVGNIAKTIVNFNSFATVRATVTNFPGQDPADASWQCALTQSGVEFCEFAENLVHSMVFDSRYKDAIKSKLEVTDFMN